MRLTIEQIKQIPSLVETKTREQIALEFNTSIKTIGNWIMKMKMSGIRVPITRGPKPIKLK